MFAAAYRGARVSYFRETRRIRADRDYRARGSADRKSLPIAARLRSRPFGYVRRVRNRRFYAVLRIKGLKEYIAMYIPPRTHIDLGALACDSTSLAI